MNGAKSIYDRLKQIDAESFSFGARAFSIKLIHFAFWRFGFRVSDFTGVN